MPHAAEILYVFGCNEYAGLNAEESALAATMAGYWCSFAKSANPNSGSVDGAAATHWPAYNATLDEVIRLDVASAGGVTVQAGLRKTACDFQAAAAPPPVDASGYPLAHAASCCVPRVAARSAREAEQKEAFPSV